MENKNFDLKEYAVKKNKEMKYCENCKMEISYYAYNKHIRSKKHLLKSKNEIEEIRNEQDEVSDDIFESLKEMKKSDYSNLDEFSIEAILDKINKYEEKKKKLKWTK